jgi:hypothetical protein
MKWTDETKLIAINMIANNKDKADISIITGMSASSINLLIAQINNYSERVECLICGKQMKQITHKHLKKHNISFDDYVAKYPNSKTVTNIHLNKAKEFKNKNKGKTYSEIYGEKEALIKKDKISKTQIGRKAPVEAGTGITGTRRDTCLFARSTYEANIDRIFMLNGFKILGEFDEKNPRFDLQDGDNKLSYQPDRVDVDGFFEKDALLEIKGYMFPEDWKKICLFREQYPSKKLLVISDDIYYRDISYADLKNKYKDKINLWEDYKNNYKTRPDLYKIDYIEPEKEKMLKAMYPDNICIDITNSHKRFIAQKCINFNKISKGENVYIKIVNLVAISNRRKGSSRMSSGEYNYEMWEVITDKNDIFYVANIEKTTLFYCYENDNKLKSFFDKNIDMSLSFGRKCEIKHDLISDGVWLVSSRQDVLQKLNDSLKHHGYKNTVVECSRSDFKKSNNKAINDYEKLKIKLDNGEVLYYSNFDNPTNVYSIRFS